MKMSEKNRLEEAACNYFIEAYNQLNSTGFKIKQHRDKPDFVVEDSVSDQVIGIEITYLYYDAEDAKMLLGRSKKRLHEPHGLMKHTDWIKALNVRLHEKDLAARKYNFEHRMFLVIRVAPSPFDKSTLSTYGDDIVIPPDVFDEIWLLFYDLSRQAWADLKRLKWGQPLLARHKRLPPKLFRNLVCAENGVTHIYIGQLGGCFKPQRLLVSPNHEAIYHQDGMWVSEVMR